MTPEKNSFRKILALSGVAFAAVGALGFLIGAERPASDPHWLSHFYFAAQDAGFALLIALALVVSAAVPAWSFARMSPGGWRYASLAALLALAACLAGRFLLLGDYNLTRDEQLADFDASVLASGALYAEPPAAWAQMSSALNELFFLPTSDGFLWISNYLPVNAALRALAGTFSGADLVNPLLVAVGALALWRIIRRLRPDDPGLIIPALALYALSAQILIAGMTSYAMTGHLAFNLVWLWLFLKRTRAADFGALGVAFLATGLHQPLFHPLFAAPFLLLLVSERQWRRAIVYGAGYAVIAAFWFAWPSIVLAAAGAEPGPSASYAVRIIKLIAAFNPADASLMALNLIRWLTWQHALFAPLLALGFLAALRRSGVERALAICVALHIPVLFFLLAYQGHGFGFRYLHGVMGPAILLCVLGYQSVSRRFAASALLASSLATAVFLLPAQAAKASAHYRAYGDVSRRIDRSGADIAIIDAHAAPFAIDLVANAPNLGNRPIRVIAQALDERAIAALCEAAPSVVYVGRNDLQRIRDLFRAANRPMRREPLAIIEAVRVGGCNVRALSGV